MSCNSKKNDLTIIGGGFAGLAAALRLQQAGVKFQVIEKRPFFGGRAYSFREPKTGTTVDNGQHLLMGAYHETFAFLKTLGTLDKLAFQEQLKVSYASKHPITHTLTCPRLPAPFHLGLGLLNFNGLKLKDKWGMARLIRFCQNNLSKPNGHGSLDEWSLSRLLLHTKQTPEAIRIFWEPLVLATLNEPLTQASSELFFKVLQLGLLTREKDSRLVFPKVGFNELYTKPATKYLQKYAVPLHFQTQVYSIQRVLAGEQSYWEILTVEGKKVTSTQLLLAVPPDALAKILKNSPGILTELQQNLAQFKPAPILSINLWFQDFIPRDSFVGLLDSPLHWIFYKAKLLHNSSENYLSIVVSGAHTLAQKSKKELIALALEELQYFYPELKEKKLLHSQVIKEHGATFSGRIGLKKYRPPSKTALPGLYLAGDWTATDLPATIESAVKSGHQAASTILQDG